MALQHGLGLLSERRIGNGRGHFVDSGAVGQAVEFKSH